MCGNGWGECPDPELEPLPRYNFDYVAPAMSSVFVLMTGEWIDAMGPAIGSIGQSSIAFFIFAVLIGRYLIMNLLIAILLNAFADDTEPEPRCRGSSCSRSRGAH